MNENDVNKILSDTEKKEIGFNDDKDLEKLHNELGISDSEKEDTEISNINKNTPKKKTTSSTKKNNKTSEKIKKEDKNIENGYNLKNNKINNIESLLSGINVDLNNIEIEDNSVPLEKLDSLDFIINGNPTYQVVCNQSGYIAHVESLKLKDINSITNSSADAYASRMKLYKTIFSKINTTSVGNLSFEQWLKLTSFFDLQTLLYGIYCQTFPDDSEFQITCKNCKKTVNVKVNNETLICTKQDTLKKMDEIINSATSPNDLINNSLVHKFTRNILPQSKIIVDVQTPSLFDQLQLFSSINKNKIKESEDIIGIMLFIKKLFIPNIKELVNNKSLKFTEITDKNQISSIIQNLKIIDSTELGNAIENRSNKYGIDYKIKSFKCPFCKEEIGDIPVNIENLLFNQILQM